jgi:Ran GTPase-activating protein (RanGAP) involved in mRNA processing and transport
LVGNASLRKIDVSKTELNDKIVDCLGKFIAHENCGLIDLDVSRNNISDLGSKSLFLGVIVNKTLEKLNIEYNFLRSEGCRFLSVYLNTNKSMTWLNLANNKISNEGIGYLA